MQRKLTTILATDVVGKLGDAIARIGREERVLATGFAHPEALHNAVHDARHSLAFPCH